LNYNYGFYAPEDPANGLGWIVRVDSEGRYISDFGGPESVPEIDGVSQWPIGPEDVECDAAGNIWVSGFHPSDTVILRMTTDGEFIEQFGRRNDRGGNDDTTKVGSVASVYHDVDNHEIFVADGYGNSRIIAFDSKTWECTRLWGSYGKHPSELSEAESWGSPVHRILKAPNGLYYVCDRSKNRVQEFELIPGGARYLREVYVGPETWNGTGTTWNIDFTPDSRYMLVADGSAMKVWTVDMDSFEVLGWTSVLNHEDDDNIGCSIVPLHQLVRMPNGDLLIAQTRKGLQVLEYLGVE